MSEFTDEERAALDQALADLCGEFDDQLRLFMRRCSVQAREYPLVELCQELVTVDTWLRKERSLIERPSLYNRIWRSALLERLDLILSPDHSMGISALSELQGEDPVAHLIRLAVLDHPSQDTAERIAHATGRSHLLVERNAYTPDPEAHANLTAHLARFDR